jgi:hypothetical protein
MALSLVAWGILGLGTPGLAARPVEIRYYKDVWPYEPKQGVQFFSPTEGWVGVTGISSGRGKPNQPYLLVTTRSVDDLHPAPGLQLPPEHRLNALFFLDRQVGWVVVSEMKAGGGPTRLWRTEDGGKTWEELANNIPPGGIGQLQFVSSTTGWLLKRGVWLTEDGGTTWRQLPLKPAEGDTSFTKMVFLTPTEGWVAGRGTVYYTADGGETWTLQYDGTGTGRLWARGLHFPSATEGWVVGDSKYLVRTRDGGRTWRPVRVTHPRMGPYDKFTAVHFLSPQVGVVAGQHNARETVPKDVQRRASPIAFSYFRPYLLVTFDGGRTWSYHNHPIPDGDLSQGGSTLFGIKTVNWLPEETGIVEIRLTPPSVKSPKR